jgi:phosphate starvation-inducible PhoH-like protein
MKIYLKSTNKSILPRSPSQETFIEAMENNELVFGIGPAGTGKTYLAVAMGASLLMSGKVERLILSRPAIEAGERLGFLPGDLKEKVDPYLRPIYDALYEMFPRTQVEKLISSGTIEIAPLAFMRGRTLSHAYVILDEAQNTTPLQMKMFLTRLGEGSRMVVTGDVTQIDLPSQQESGLVDAQKRFKNIPSIAFVEFGSDDVVRHPLVSKIVKAYGP